MIATKLWKDNRKTINGQKTKKKINSKNQMSTYFQPLQKMSSAIYVIKLSKSGKKYQIHRKKENNNATGKNLQNTFKWKFLLMMIINNNN